MEILNVSALNKVYVQGEKHIYAVHDAWLSVNKGEFTAVVGASGSGKSTLLSLIAGNIKPTSGKIILDGTDMTAASGKEIAEIKRRKIGFVYQQFNLLPGLTARENIILPSLLDGHKPDEKWFDYITEILGINDRLEHLPSELSGGQMQRVAIARALINRPLMLIADEPTGNLDKETSDEIISLFMKLHEEGHTLIIVTHDANLASLADTVYRIDSGKVSRENREVS